MNEHLLLAVAQKRAAGLPVIGYNFDKGISTGTSILTPSGLVATTVPSVPPPSAYDKSVLITKGILNGVTPNFNLGTGDFTVELVMNVNTSTNGYAYLFRTRLNGKSNDAIRIRIGDNGLNNRLQVCTHADGATTGTWSVDVARNRAWLFGRWVHVALVRKSGLLFVYVDGVNTGLALWTSTTYTTNGVASTDDLSNTTTYAFGDDSYPANTNLAEFALYDYAKYTANFAPKFPLVAA